MKPKFKNLFAAAILLSGAVLFSDSLMAQEKSDKKEGSKNSKVRIRIEKDVNGKTTVLDTVITSGDEAALDKIEQMTEFNEDQLKNAEEQAMKAEIYMKHFDSLMHDSAAGMERKMREIEKEVRKYRLDDGSTGFNYRFEIPPVPGVPDIPDVEAFDFPHFRMMRDDDEGTLSDILGDIPLSSVKSYKIKETSDGKRIIIDLDDEPVIRKHGKVIIIKEGRPVHPAHKGHQRHMERTEEE